MTKRIDELVQSIAGARTHPLAPLLRRWCEESRPFLAFAETHASKIRKKARLASREELADLFAELAVAAFLARDRRFKVLYEPYLASGQRGPDFQVLFKTHTPFHTEVTRLRLLEAGTDDPASVLKLARVLHNKIGQFPAGAMNLLVVVVPLNAQSDDLIPAAIHLLDSYPQQEAIGGDVPELPPEGVRAYHQFRRRLSAIALWSFTSDWHSLHVTLWQNPQAKHPLHPDISKYLVRTATRDDER